MCGSQRFFQVWSFQGFAIEFWKHTPDRFSALEGFIDAVPKDKFVIIDMDYGEGEWLQWHAFSQAPFVWSKLHEFGGTDGLKGNLTRAAELPSRALKATPMANIIGTGFTSEGIDQNPAVPPRGASPWSFCCWTELPAFKSRTWKYYDLILDSHFRDTPFDPTSYAVARALKRYNVKTAAVAAATARAWTRLSQSVYSKDESVQDTTGVPHLPGTAKWAWQADRHTPTDEMCHLFGAWGDLLAVASAATLPLDEPLRYDLIDVGREVACGQERTLGSCMRTNVVSHPWFDLRSSRFSPRWQHRYR